MEAQHAALLRAARAMLSAMETPRSRKATKAWLGLIDVVNAADAVGSEGSIVTVDEAVARVFDEVPMIDRAAPMAGVY